MIQSPISSVSDRYRIAADRQSPRTTGVYLSPVRDAVGAEFAWRVRAVDLEPGSDQSSPSSVFQRAARQLRWVLGVDPVPLEDGGYAAARVGELRSAYSQLAGNVGAETQRAMDAVVASLSQLTRKYTPLGLALLEDVAELGSDSMLIVPRSAAIPAVESWLTAELGPGAPRVRSAAAAALDQDVVWSSIVCLGPPRTYDSGDRYQLNALVAGGMSETLEFLYPSWLQTFSEPTPRLTRGLIGSIDDTIPVFWARVTPIRGESGSDTVEPTMEEDIDWVDVDIDVELDAHHGSLADAVRVDLADGSHFFVEAAAERITTVNSDSGTWRVEFRRLSELGVGDIVAVQMHASETTELRKLAFAILGDEASVVRESQFDWKAKLVDLGQAQGWKYVGEQLSSSGVHAYAQARHWVSETMIRPRRNQDFELLLSVLGFPEQERRAIVDHARRLLGAVHIAARRLSLQLEAAIQARGAELGVGAVVDVTQSGRLVRSYCVAVIERVGDHEVRVPEGMLRRAIRGPDG